MRKLSAQATESFIDATFIFSRFTISNVSDIMYSDCVVARVILRVKETRWRSRIFLAKICFILLLQL